MAASNSHDESPAPTVKIADIEFQSHLHQHQQPAISPPHNDSSINKYIKKLSQNEIIAVSGALSGFLAGVTVCPLDVVKTRLQAQGSNTSGTTKKYSGFINTLKKISNEEGIKGLYRGLVPITIGYLPTWMIYFSVYEKAKNFYPSFFDKHFNLNIDLLNHFTSAITAGSMSSIATNPIWVVKTRLMLQQGNGKTIDMRLTNTTNYYTSTFDAFRKIYKYEGLKSFYSGLVPSLFGLCHVAIHFPTYEKLKQLLNIQQDSTLGPINKLNRLIIASSVSKMIASTLTYPHEILRTRLQINSNIDKRLIHLIKLIYVKEGLKGFYSGYFTNLARTVPSSAVTLVSFEYLKNYLEGVKYS